ncbi:MAG: outer membrane beta-barrel protein [Gammaproteobacteria bacterium]
MKVINKILILLCGSLLVFSPTVYAGNESGIFIGAAVGDTAIKATNFSEKGTSGKIILGYNMGIIPLVDISFEASYINFGKASQNNNGVQNNYDISGVDAFGVVGFKLGPIGVFAKAGGINWSSDIVKNNVSSSKSGTDAAYGVGAKVQFGSMTVRLEYELFDVSAVDELNMLSIGILVTY